MKTVLLIFTFVVAASTAETIARKIKGSGKNTAAIAAVQTASSPASGNKSASCSSAPPANTCTKPREPQRTPPPYLFM